MKIPVEETKSLVPSVKRCVSPSPPLSLSAPSLSFPPFPFPPLPLHLPIPSLPLNLKITSTVFINSQEVAMSELEGHLEAYHSVDTATPTGGLHLVDDNFSCACGRTFHFQDDLQVHQVYKLTAFNTITL